MRLRRTLNSTAAVSLLLLCTLSFGQFQTVVQAQDAEAAAAEEEAAPVFDLPDDDAEPETRRPHPLEQVPKGPVDRPFYSEFFDSGVKARWRQSRSPEYAGQKFNFTTPPDFHHDVDDPSIELPLKAQRYGISHKLEKPIDVSNGVVVQFALKTFHGILCGGAYLKFLAYDPDFRPKDLSPSTPYSIMFGPDACGSKRMIQIIIQYKNPVTGELEEKSIKNDLKFHGNRMMTYYTLSLRKDGTFGVYMNWDPVLEGNINDAFRIDPPMEIYDPEDTFPEDWDDREFIPDPTDVKPEDWDEEAPLFIEDPNAVKPADYDEETKGPWKPTFMRNPDYKGPWEPRAIENPAFQGQWAPQIIPNPDYHHDEEPLSRIPPIGGIAIEVWTMERQFFFDDIVIAPNDDSAKVGFGLQYRQKRDAEDRFHQHRFEATKARLGDGPRLARIVLSWLDNPKLPKGARPHLVPAVHLVYYHPWTFYVIVAGPPALVMSTIAWCCRPRRRTKRAAKAPQAEVKKDPTEKKED